MYITCTCIKDLQTHLSPSTLSEMVKAASVRNVAAQNVSRRPHYCDLEVGDDDARVWATSVLVARVDNSTQ